MELTFAECVLNLSSRQLSRDGVVVPLEPKMYTLLEVLIERRPAVVTNEELDELLWPQVYVARTSLTRLVSELRAVLKDSPRDSRIIRTVYKTGYAFAAPVAVVTGSAITEDAESARIATGVTLLWQQRLLALGMGENIAGRGAECRLVIDATTVSRKHAIITVGAGIVTIEDLQSTNGTYVNKKPISVATCLNDGDDIGFGTAELRIHIANRSAPTVIDPARRKPGATN